MDKYEELIAVFSETLEQSRDYHIAYMYQVGYITWRITLPIFSEKHFRLQTGKF